MPGADVIDLCASDSGASDSDEDLPPLASLAPLAARLQQRLGAAAHAPAAAATGTQDGGWRPPPAAGAAAAAPRPPLSALHNHSQGSPTAKLNGVDAELLRPQYHQQEQRQQRQQLAPAAAAAAPSSGARRGKREAPSGGLQQPDAWGGLGGASPGGGEFRDEEDEEWQPDGSQPSQRASRQPARGRGSGGSSQQPSRGGGGSGGLEGEVPPGKKPRKPRRTKEEIERDKAVQAQLREEKKQLKQATTKAHALAQVRLVVDQALVSSSGAPTNASSRPSNSSSVSLGVRLLAHLAEHNAHNPSKNIEYEVAQLDLAPFKALRWQRKRLVGGLAAAGAAWAATAAAAAARGEGGAGPASQQQYGTQQLGTQASGSGLEEQWDEEPHVMVCFQPQEFVDAFLRDRLASLFALLERRARGQRPYLMVVGLMRHIELEDRRQQQAAMRGGPQAVPVRRSVRRDIEDFVASLAVECPRLSFRDVVDAAQAAQHVQLLTSAISVVPFRDTDAAAFLRAHDKSNSQSVTNLFINHPLEDPNLKPCIRSLAALPSVRPGIAYALANNYGSMGGLMDMLLDPHRTDREKQQEIAAMGHVGTSKRVGPVAARQLLQLLRSDDPDLRVKEGKEEEAAPGADGDA